MAKVPCPGCGAELDTESGESHFHVGDDPILGPDPQPIEPVEPVEGDPEPTDGPGAIESRNRYRRRHKS